MSAVKHFFKQQHAPRKPRSFDEHFRNLSGDQVGPVHSMRSLGYSLWFVRELEDGSKLAVLEGGGIAAVTDNGEITLDAEIDLRKP